MRQGRFLTLFNRRRWLIAGLALMPLAALVLFSAGFSIFLTKLERHESETRRRADAIVALTGGAERIADAIDLLGERQARRLLITGVHSGTSTEMLRKRLPGRDALFDCCIDIDYNARNTIGNAIETRRWAEQHRFRSLIVVTSAYHMPRTLLEVAREMPSVELIPHVVVTPHSRIDRWWHDPGVARLLLVEYVKYLAALAWPDAMRAVSGEPLATARAAAR